MHYVSGTTTDFHDIVDAMVNLMTSALGGGWTVIMSRNTRDNAANYGASVEEPDMASTCTEMILKSTGYGGADNFYIGIREWDRDDYATPLSGFDLAVLNHFVLAPPTIWNYLYGTMTGAINTYNNTYNRFSSHPGFCTTQGVNMDYWISSSPQRVMAVVKILSNYESFYVGAGDRFGNPSDYPCPMFACSTSQGINAPDEALATRAKFVPAGGSVAHVITPGNYMLTAGNILTLPYEQMQNVTSYELQSLNNDRRLCMPVLLVNASTNPHELLMELEGVYQIFGQLISSEDEISIDGSRHLVFQNLHETDYYQYMAFPIATSTTTTTTTSTTTTTTTTTV